jgi:two-component system, NarL family, sensor histidine kinase LiaS
MSGKDRGIGMRGRWGLQAKMTASYVLVTAAVVVLVELVAAVVVLPRLVSGADRATQVQLLANATADQVMQQSATLGRLPTASQLRLDQAALGLPPDQAREPADEPGVAINPFLPQRAKLLVPAAVVVLLLAPDGRVVASSDPARYPLGKRLGDPAMGALPAQVTTRPPTTWRKRDGLTPTPTRNGTVLWTAAPVLDLSGLDKATKPSPASDLLGVVYVQLPATAKLTDQPSWWEVLRPQLGVGLLVLAGAVPVGLVFGLLSTRRLVGRLRRLAATTVAVADGDYRHRVPVSGGDEVAQLEGDVNRMAERLDAAMATQRQLASAGERARIARELHDAVSQDLFSLRLLAGGLRKALPAGSPLRPQVETMEQTATATMHEMQALLLELRPVALADAGLVPALEELCDTYRERLGVTIDADLEPVELASPAEHAVLRVVQEALANAVKHAQPTRIRLRLSQQDGQVAVTVDDDGGGFDPSLAEQRHGMGLGLMQQRVAELGGSLQLDSTAGRGTSVRILLPGDRP